MWMTYIKIPLLLLVLELAYFRIADKFNIIDKPTQFAYKDCTAWWWNNIHLRFMDMEYLVWGSISVAAGWCDTGCWSVVC